MPRSASMADGDRIDFEIFGNSGPFVFLGPQIFLTPMIASVAPIAKQYIDSLANRYRVIVADWPRGTGHSSPARGPSMTGQKVVEDIGRIADAAGADRFAWWGYSFGGSCGLQLASGNDRISALVCGGFPPLWQPISDMLNSVRRMERQQETLAHLIKVGMPSIDPELHKQNIAYYVSLSGQDERALVEAIRCPRMVFHDKDDVVELGGLRHDLASRTRAAETDLIDLGWDVAWVETGRQHFAMSDADACLSVFAPFLDRVLLK